MKIKALTSATLIAVATMSNPAMAVEKGDWLVRAGWTLVSPKSGNSEIVRVEDASSLGLNFSYFITNNLAVELQLAGDLEQKGFMRFLLRATNRIAFPMSMLLYLILTRFVLGQFGVNTAVLDIFTPLLLSLAGIKLGVYVLRSGFTPSPALRAWENVLSLTVWGVLALHLLGWLPDVIKAMDEFAFTFGETRISVLSFIQLTISIIIFIMIATWLVRFI